MEFALKSPRDAKILALTLALGFFYSGYCAGIFNPLAEPLLLEVFSLNPSTDQDAIDFYQGAFNALFSLGGMLGVFAAGSLANKFGRVPLLYLCELLALGNALLFVVRDLRAILVGRFISGLITGFTSISSIITSELLPNSVSGLGNAGGYLIGTFAMLLAYVTQNLLSKQQLVQHYRELLMGPSLVTCARLLLLSRYLETDTPHYLFKSSWDTDTARQRLKQCYRSIYDEQDADAAAEEAFATFKKQAAGSAGASGFTALFGPTLRLRVFSGCFLAAAQQVCGINFFIFYSTKIFDEISGSGKAMTLVVGLSNLLGAGVALALIGRLGRKFNLVWGCLLQAVSLLALLLGIHLRLFAVLALAACGYVVGFAVGLGGSYQAYLCEILPPLGVGVAQTLQWVLTALVGQFTPLLSSALGPRAVLLGFAVVCVLLFFGLAKFTVETKGKKEQQIADAFEKGGFVMFDFK